MPGKALDVFVTLGFEGTTRLSLHQGTVSRKLIQCHPRVNADSLDESDLCRLGSTQALLFFLRASVLFTSPKDLLPRSSGRWVLMNEG